LSSNPTTDNILHRLIFFNEPINVIPVNSIIDLHKTHLDTQIYYMCIYNSAIEIGSILHFFTIIRVKDKYYLNSSYGSDYVCVPQYTQLLVLEEFNNFCIDLPGKSPNLINFYTKYFLKYNLQKRYNNNTIEDLDPSLKSKWISPLDGISKETKLLVESDNVFSVGLINNYEELIEQYIGETKLGYGYRKSPKRKSPKRKSSKRKSSKRKSSKRKSPKSKYYKK
jgi:hypothetical protein